MIRDDFSSLLLESENILTHISDRAAGFVFLKKVALSCKPFNGACDEEERK